MEYHKISLQSIDLNCFFLSDNDTVFTLKFFVQKDAPQF